VTYYGPVSQKIFEEQKENKTKLTMVPFGTGAVLGASLMYSSIVPRNDAGG
jgi:hypothetical protein